MAHFLASVYSATTPRSNAVTHAFGGSNGWLWRAIVALAVAAALTTGCTAATTPSAAAVATTTPAPSVTTTAGLSPSPAATPAPTPAPTPGPSATALCAKNQSGAASQPCLLAPGTYSAAPFAPLFRFTIGPGWTNVGALAQAGEIAKAGVKGSCPSIFTAYCGTAFDWNVGVTAAGTAGDIGKTSDSLLAFFASQPLVKVSDPVPLTIGGMTGRSIDVTLNKGFIELKMGPTSLPFQSGHKVRVIVLDVSGAVVMLDVNVPTETEFPAELITLQPILDSITWQ